jgi:tripartite-type tricarboxylate transporter receptor subunit TctC
MSEIHSWYRRGLIALGALALVGGTRAQAQVAAGRPLRIVVPFGAGGIADLTVRIVAEHVSATLSQSVVVENRPGAGGIVAAEQVARAAPDGQTLLLMSNANAVSVNLFRSLPVDPLVDFAPVGLIGAFGLGVVVAASSPHTSLAALMQWAKRNPGRLNIGSINVGSTQHLTAELLRLKAGLDAQVVPFNGTPALITALRGGHIDAGVEILGPLRPHLAARSGEAGLRLLAVTTATRSADLAAVPTVAEAGVSDFDASSWNALAAPARTPQTVIERLNQALQRALADSAVKSRLAELGVAPMPGSPAELAAHLVTEIRRWGEVIERAGVARQ